MYGGKARFIGIPIAGGRDWIGALIHGVRWQRNSFRGGINNSRQHFARYFREGTHYSAASPCSMISVVLVLSASDDGDVDDDGEDEEDDPSPRTTLLCLPGEDSGGFDYDIVPRRVPDAA